MHAKEDVNKTVPAKMDVTCHGASGTTEQDFKYGKTSSNGVKRNQVQTDEGRTEHATLRTNRGTDQELIVIAPNMMNMTVRQMLEQALNSYGIKEQVERQMPAKQVRSDISVVPMELVQKNNDATVQEVRKMMPTDDTVQTISPDMMTVKSSDTPKHNKNGGSTFLMKETY